MEIRKGDKIKIIGGKKRVGVIGVVVKVTPKQYAYTVLQGANEFSVHYVNKEFVELVGNLISIPVIKQDSLASEDEEDDGDESGCVFADRIDKNLLQQIQLLSELLEEKLALADGATQQHYIGQLQSRFTQSGNV